MDIHKILKELRSEKEEVERAITALERIGGKRRGRRPQWMKAMEKPTQTEQKKKQSKDKEN